MAQEPDFEQRPTEEKKVRPEKEVHQTVEMAREYAVPVVIGVAIALVAVLMFTLRQQQASSARDQASEILLNAQTAEQFQVIVDQYPNTPSAPMAKLALAAERFREGQPELARVAYSQFLEQHAEHPMRPSAELGLAYTDEAMGNLEPALAGFMAFHAGRPGHFLAPVAKLSEARVLGQLGRADEARAIYEAMLDDPDQPWHVQARTDLLYLEKAQRALAQN